MSCLLYRCQIPGRMHCSRLGGIAAPERPAEEERGLQVAHLQKEPTAQVQAVVLKDVFLQALSQPVLIRSYWKLRRGQAPRRRFRAHELNLQAETCLPCSPVLTDVMMVSFVA